MSFSEDPSSPAAPFSGDGTGQIFDLPDMVALSPTTTERVVDTQSGFLVVIKKFNDRLALSVKRRIGTPPASSVPLTPDESLKLSRILSSSFAVADEWDTVEPSKRKDRRAGDERRRDDRRLRMTSSLLFGKDTASRDDQDDSLDRDRGAASPYADLEAPSRPLANANVPIKIMLASVLRTFMVPILGIALSVFALGIGAGVTTLKLVTKEQVKSPVVVADPLETKKVDSFVRDFVAKLLDFTAKTYRVSQVQAMAAMSPELLERYWQETKFPLSKRQLSALPQGANILITELKQERVDANSVVVDVHAQLSDVANPKIATPVNLRLKLALDAAQQIIVTDQQDISSTPTK